MQINRIVSHPTTSILVTAHEDEYIGIFDITTKMRGQKHGKQVRVLHTNDKGVGVWRAISSSRYVLYFLLYTRERTNLSFFPLAPHLWKIQIRKMKMIPNLSPITRLASLLVRLRNTLHWLLLRPLQVVPISPYTAAAATTTTNFADTFKPATVKASCHDPSTSSGSWFTTAQPAIWSPPTCNSEETLLPGRAEKSVRLKTIRFPSNLFFITLAVITFHTETPS
jgi:hypothetical protein